jgi:hypothetical protein
LYSLAERIAVQRAARRFPSATADEAAVAVPSPTLETAPQARSHTVHNENTAANGAVPGEAPVSRETQIGQLAQLAGKDLAWTMNAITSAHPSSRSSRSLRASG